jgi:hydroxymethylpyrimidine pyrophosphatase-like HAD family hydrolase
MRRALFVTDLDGTLLRGGEFSRADIAALEELPSAGATVVLATGRSHFSYMRTLADRHLPVDYLVLSSGACILDNATGERMHGEWMTRVQAAAAAEVLFRLELDFAIHEELPGNHRFLHSFRSGSNPDMERRIRLYREYCRPFEEGVLPARCTQLVAIVPPDGGSDPLKAVLEALGVEYSVLRTTSPLDGESLWIEIFPRGVCKSSGTGWIAERLGVDPSCTAAVGNDWNDCDLLDWAAVPFVMEGSPPGLSRGSRTVSSVSDAIAVWLEMLPASCADLP